MKYKNGSGTTIVMKRIKSYNCRNMEIGLREEENDSEDKVTIGIQTYYLTLQDKKKR